MVHCKRTGGTPDRAGGTLGRAAGGVHWWVLTPVGCPLGSSSGTWLRESGSSGLATNWSSDTLAAPRSLQGQRGQGEGGHTMDGPPRVPTHGCYSPPGCRLAPVPQTQAQAGRGAQGTSTQWPCQCLWWEGQR